MRPLLLASILFVGLIGSSAAIPAPIPYHAFCRTVWLFGLPCADVRTRLVHQIQAFSSVNGCEKCHYTLVSTTKEAIYGHHTSSKNLCLESMEFNLHTTIMTGSCRVTAQSASLSFTSLLDDGLNYCNLYDLLTASGLVSAPGFEELINEWSCLGYGLATCKA